ncbi:MAG: hypothetical protein WD904_00275 [Dehalococcoidia bacterium]
MPSSSALAATTERVSVDSSEAQADGGSHDPAITPDGRFVAFRSSASNLVSGDTNGRLDVFVRDRTLGTTVRVNLDSNDTQSTGLDYGNIAITPNGRFVAFNSNATDLVAGDTNNAHDVFVRDRDTDGDGTYDEPGAVSTTRVSDTYTGLNGNGTSVDPDMSSDGRFVTYYSFASNLLPTDTNGANTDIIVRDRDADTDGIYDESGAVSTIRVNVSSADVQGNNISVSPAISGTGRFVAFTSSANNLVTGDTNNQYDIFVRDRDTDNDGVFDEPGAVATTRVNLSTAGGQSSNGSSDFPDISDNGRYVSYQSGATGLVSPDTNGLDIFVRDRDTDSDNIFDEAGAVSTSLASIDSNEAQVAGNHQWHSMSPDGRYVGFMSDATTLVPGDTNNCFGTPGDCRDIFVRDRTGGYTVRASVASDGTQANNESSVSFGVSYIGNGGVVAFSSGATNLVADDSNGFPDIFVRLADSDGDLIMEPADNCPDTPNSNQANADADATGNVCDTEGPSPNTAGLAGADDCNDGVDNDGDGLIDGADPTCDADGDGTAEVVDNCPGLANVNQANPDGDAYGTACDNCPTTAGADLTDTDGDGHGNICDNCPNTDNGLAEGSVFGVGNQTDSDGDGVPGTQPPPLGTFGGDACDYDDDNDGVPDDAEWPGCRRLAEDYDGYQDTDGCPDPDNDSDGICDAGQTAVSCTGSDSGQNCYDPAGTLTCSAHDCRNIAEDYDAFKDTDGCPEPDNDNDGFSDATDDCPGTGSLAGADGMLGSPQDANHNGIRDGAEAVHTSDDSWLTFEDYDGVLDTDGCHDSPGDDYDGDGFTDEDEVFIVRTLPYDADTDNDTVVDGADNCANWPNTAQNLPAWPVGTPAADADCDGFSSASESTIGTDPTRQCPGAGGTPDSWPADLVPNGTINILDVTALKPVFGQSVPPASARYDIAGGGSINILDVTGLKPFFGKSCS